MKWWFFPTLWHSPSFCSESHLMVFLLYIQLLYHETTSRRADMVASDTMSQRQQPLVQRSACENNVKRIKCKCSCPSSLQEKKLEQVPVDILKKIFKKYKNVKGSNSSSKSKLGIFPILEAHTGFVDSHWNRWHVPSTCLGALNPPLSHSEMLLFVAFVFLHNRRKHQDRLHRFWVIMSMSFCLSHSDPVLSVFCLRTGLAWKQHLNSQKDPRADLVV